MRRPFQKTAGRRSSVTGWLAITAVLVLGSARAVDNTSATDDGWIHATNRGVALLENGDFVRAGETFLAVLESRPGDMAARRNLARAQLFGGDSQTALATLEAAQSDAAGRAATEYLTALAFLRREDPQAALLHLETSVRLDPFTPTARYQLAKLYEGLGRAVDALTHFHETVRLDPQHASAHFEIAMHARNQRDLETYREELRIYKRLRDVFGDPETSPLQLEACAHTRAESPVPPVRSSGPAPVAAAPVRFVAMAAAGADADDASPGAIAALAPLDLDRSGRYTFVAVTRGGDVQRMTIADDGSLRRDGEAVRITPPGESPVIRVGHFHESIASADRLKPDLPRFSDVLIVGSAGVSLLERSAADVLVDVTERAGLSGAAGGRDAVWIDYEHDGDLDFVVVGEQSVVLWQNRGDGRFEEATAAAGLAGMAPGDAVALADLDANGAVDLVVAHSAATHILENQRAGRFRVMPEPPGPWPAAQHVLIDDLDNDGAPDVVLVGEGRTQFKMGARAGTASIEHPGLLVRAAAFVDYDNDGWLDLCLAATAADDPARGVARVWRNAGSDDWRETTSELGLDGFVTTAVRAVLALDHDGDHDSDLLLLGDDGRIALLRNDGGNAHGQVKLQLNSLAMSNHGGIGATIALRAGPTVIHRFVGREPPLEIGVGALTQFDAVQVVWPDGTVDNLIDLTPAGELVTVERVSSIITGSCPYLYAWDGKRFRFVTDFLGSGAIGLALTRGATWPPDPVELVRIGNEREFLPRDGRYVVTITSELREVDYFDALKLIAVDHPPDVEVHPTDSFMPPPVAPSVVWAMAGIIPLRTAHDSEGHDVSESLRRVDGVFALPGDVLPPPFRGVCHPITYTLDFGALPTDEPLTLALTGLLEFGTASSNIALSQTDTASLVWPTLEAEASDGQWLPVSVNLGIPDGRTKTSAADLTGLLPSGARRLRLTTSFQIYWDRIALFQRRQLAVARVHERAFVRADLQWRGFSRMKTASDGYTRVPVYDDVSQQPPWHTTLEGWCTRYGDVLELINEPDGKLAILNGGDALQLEIDEKALPPVSAGLTRTFFLSAVGWDKEENNNTVGGATVAPLPGQPPVVGSGEELDGVDWTQLFNTRWVPRDRFSPDRSSGNH